MVLSGPDPVLVPGGHCESISCAPAIEYDANIPRAAAAAIIRAFILKSVNGLMNDARRSRTVTRKQKSGPAQRNPFGLEREILRVLSLYAAVKILKGVDVPLRITRCLK